LEISVALDHDVDDLLVSLVAELKEAYTSNDNSVEQPSPRIEDDFSAAIRRYSQRKKKAAPEDINAGTVTTISSEELRKMLGSLAILYLQQI
ncbi:hypothetical protein GCK32_019995, partial [Trichostrongylus colubriformis]